MLLETLDLRTNDILIYSKNVFNFENSFKIILKNEKIKRPRKISYFDVCNYVKDPTPKNLVCYRLLTNVQNLDAYSTKYGYFIKINGKIELIYFDPIFAIKDLRHLRFELNPTNFRFRIQQVGLTSLTKKETEPNFAEVYSFDLKAIEAQSQNDKIFADAIFAFDDTFIDDEDSETFSSQKRFVAKPDSIISTDSTSKLIEKAKTIAEDKAIPVSSFKSPAPPDIDRVQNLREEIVLLLKQALDITPGTKITENVHPSEKIREFIAEKKLETVTNQNEPVNNVFDLFKTTNKSSELSEREKESIILKFD